MTIATETQTEAVETVETSVAEEFAGRMVGVFNDSALCLLLSIGHQTGLLDTLATLPPSTSAEIAATADLDERYVLEWLNGVVAGRVVEHDPERASYWLPAEHAASLTTAAGPENFARMMQLIPLLAEVEPKIVACFREGGGVGYDAFPRFHALMAEDSAATHDAGLLDLVVPVVPGLHETLSSGAAVADVGCGSGHAINLLARAYPSSRFVGYDFSDEAIEAARQEAEAWGLPNTTFIVGDVVELDVSEEYDVVTAFDAIHDQAYPAQVLSNIATALKSGGTFLMVDIKASSHVHDNIEHPAGTFLYTASLMHCMTVSLAQGGVGLGTAWGTQTALRMLAEAGFVDVDLREVETDFFNAYYVARKA